MNALQIGITIFGFWLSIIGPLTVIMLFLYNKTERAVNKWTKEIERGEDIWTKELKEHRQHWADLLKSFCDFKNVTVERFAKLENKDQ